MFELEGIVAADSGVLSAVRVNASSTARACPINAVGSLPPISDNTLWRLAEDRDRRRRALAFVAESGWGGAVHIEILAASAEDCDVCSMALLADARAARIKPTRLVLELSETEEVDDPAKLALATGVWRSMGFRTATRHFGNGLSGLGMLMRLEPDVICLDGAWVRRVAIDPGTRIILAGVVSTCRELACDVIADGVVSASLSDTLRDLGILRQSGPYFQPVLERYSRPRLSTEGRPWAP